MKARQMALGPAWSRGLGWRQRFVPPPAGAQEYPSHPIAVVVAYAPGGATDLQARLVMMLAEQYLGQPIVVSNCPGEGGQVGWIWLVEEGPEDVVSRSTIRA